MMFSHGLNIYFFSSYQPREKLSASALSNWNSEDHAEETNDLDEFELPEELDWKFPLVVWMLSDWE